MQAERVLRKEELEAITGLTERTIRTMEAEGTFPKRFILNPGGRAVGWRAGEVQEWIAKRAASRADA
jgi:predicted DNA-binding transcriptional regulator AlpA